MCGIYGVIGDTAAADTLLGGLQRLEYRGYDSAGIATQVDGVVRTRRASGKLASLEQQLRLRPLAGNIGIGHTRWATHGKPTVENAHPHVCGPVAVVHNGIIENHHDLRQMLLDNGHQFLSQTDSEVVPHLIHHYIQQGMSPLEAIQFTVADLNGSYALGIMIGTAGEELFAARRNSPLVLGEGNDGIYLASDAIALGDTTDQVLYLEDNDVAVVSPSGLQVFDRDGKVARRLRHSLKGNSACVDRNGYDHFMLKEIHEQPEAARATLDAARKEIRHDENFASMQRLHIIACGTSYYAAAVAKYWLERFARLPVEIDIASEFRYRSPPLSNMDATLFISQSGETADTLGALKYAREAGARIYSIVNVPGSSIARESDTVYCTQAGPEIGVASTKAFTTQLVLLAMFAIRVGKAREQLSDTQCADLENALMGVPRVIETVLGYENSIKDIASIVTDSEKVLYLGRGALFPIAMEGALKLKEITYLHAEGYAAGELKHGPIALVDSDTLVVMIAPDDELYEKTASNMQEVAARNGQVLLLGGSRAARHLASQSRQVLTLDGIDPFIAPIAYVVPLQLIAYHAALIKGTDVDRPRNLAKSVTVE